MTLLKVTVSYKLNEAGRKVALLAGENASENQTITVDDPDHLLAHLIVVNSQGRAYISLDIKRYEHLKDTGWFEGNVARTIFKGVTNTAYTSPYTASAPLHTPQDVLDFIASIEAHKQKLLDAIPALQAEHDAKFESAKTAYIEKLLADLRKRLTDKEKENRNLRAEIQRLSEPPSNDEDSHDDPREEDAFSEE